MLILFPCDLLLKTSALAQMETASFCGGVRHKRYSEQLEKASKKIALKKYRFISNSKPH